MAVLEVITDTFLGVSTDILLVLVTLFLGFCAIAAPYLTKHAERCIYPPDLNLSYRDERRYRYQTRHSDDNEPVYYFRILIENIGKSRAKMCEVVLEKIWIEENGTRRESSNFFPVNLTWHTGTRYAEQYIDINPRRSVFCDIGHISSRQRQMSRELLNFRYLPEIRPDRNALCFKLNLLYDFSANSNCLQHGRYILEIGIYSENSTYQKGYFEILWSGIWKDSEIEMFNEIIIRQIIDTGFNPGYVDSMYNTIARDRDTSRTSVDAEST